VRQEGDHYGEDGRLCCGVCGEPKEAFLTWPGAEKPVKRPALCACGRARQAEKKQAQAARDHAALTEQLRRECFPEGAPEAELGEALVNPEALEACRKYAEHWQEAAREHMGLLLWGGVGTGKSWMAAAIANRLIEQEHRVQMRNMSWYLNCSGEDRAERLADVAMPELLILDDLGIERSSDFGMEILFDVIDRRCRCGKPLIVTTNLTLGMLQNPGELRLQRIFDRILEMCIPVCFTGGSLRVRKRKELLDRFRRLPAPEGITADP